LRGDFFVGRGYAPRGRTPVRRLLSRRFGVNYLATVTSGGLLRFLAFSGRLRAALFFLFLTRLLANRLGKVYVILDSHPTHRNCRVTVWAQQQSGRLRLVYLPSYSQELNPAEHLNNDVKANAQRRGRARDQRSLLKAVRSYLFVIPFWTEYVRAYFCIAPVR
jgi:transposase